MINDEIPDLTVFAGFIHRIAACGVEDDKNEEENRITAEISADIINSIRMNGSFIVISIPYKAMWEDDIEAAKCIDGYTFKGVHAIRHEYHKQMSLEIWFSKNE